MAATTPKNRITRLGDEAKSAFESAISVISAAVTFNQGDLLVFDTSAKLLKVPTSETDGSTFLGIAPVTVVSGKIKSPYVTDVDGSTAITDVPGPQYGVIGNMKLRQGDSFTPGCQVYLDPTYDVQTVAVTGTKPIGLYQGATVTAGSGTLGEVLIGCRYPNDTLKF